MNASTVASHFGSGATTAAETIQNAKSASMIGNATAQTIGLSNLTTEEGLKLNQTIMTNDFLMKCSNMVKSEMDNIGR
jgi:hypothetical protein